MDFKAVNLDNIHVINLPHFSLKINFYKTLIFILIDSVRNGLILSRIDGQEIYHQMCLKFWDMIYWAINYNLVMK